MDSAVTRCPMSQSAVVSISDLGWSRAVAAARLVGYGGVVIDGAVGVRHSRCQGSFGE